MSLVIYILSSFTVNLQLQSIGKGLIQIYSPAVGRYLAMDSNGRLFSMVSLIIFQFSNHSPTHYWILVEVSDLVPPTKRFHWRLFNFPSNYLLLGDNFMMFMPRLGQINCVQTLRSPNTFVWNKSHWQPCTF